MRKLIIDTLCLLFICILVSGCNEVSDKIELESQSPLISFKVKVGNVYYHADINQESHEMVIGTIENPNIITGVEYKLVNDKATISPDPEDFLGKWKAEQEMTVVTENGTSTVYKLKLTNLKDDLEDVLFYDGFDVDGMADENKWMSIVRYRTLEDGSKYQWEYNTNECAYVENGNLVLKAYKSDGYYKEGRVETRTKFSFTYGEVEVRAKIASFPNGNFPAIWMMPDKVIYPEPGGENVNPISGEIDIMEHLKQEANIHQTVHSNYTYHLNIKNPINTCKPTCNIDEYNLYGMKWTADEIIFYLNGRETLRYPNLKLKDEKEKMQWPFAEESAFYLILNMALSQSSTAWAGPIDDLSLPAIMMVDYVKVKKIEE
ncbi:DUF4971 domain-containing protein [Bacteroides caecigallinarum]|uniref:DUF4971 domain-containing protein n=1 Tax=Bacteroides caecigallinarum TaxID=1411144 RepID=UPI00195C2AED|nr:DUF4971 domain-containing protein [Bacteroides caecigallinarum]MBM6864905.1 DUF4971 domain-containing protein [Bacteroides caecigallinarum]